MSNREATGPWGLPCGHCGEPLTERQIRGKRKFCSANCIIAAREALARTGQPDHCATCGKPLSVYQKRTCSLVCTGLLNATFSVHSEDRRETLRRLWMQEEPRLSAAEIARQLGVTKNTIIGLRRRMGLPERASPIINRSGRPPKPRVAKPPRAPRQTLPQWSFLDRLEPKQRASLARRPARPAPRPVVVAPVKLSPFRTCQYITTSARPWVFCDAPTEEGYSWCCAHKRICLVPTPRMEARI